MNSDCCRPTHRFEPTGFDGGAYNASQVRLYGISGDVGPKLMRTLFEIFYLQGRLGEGPGEETFEEEGVDEASQEEGAVETSEEEGVDQTSEEEGAPPPLTGLLIKVPKRDNQKDNLPIMMIGISGPDGMSAGVIFGYAYEGHCYDLAKPKIMWLPTQGKRIPDDDCGFDKKRGHGYRVWVVDKLDKCIEIEVNGGFVEQLVLEANLPGKRSPTTYRATMALAHRGGRLTD